VAKIKYDNTGVESSQFKQPTPGLYTMKIEEANHRDEEGKNDIELVLVVIGGEFDGAKLWSYVGLSEPAAWKRKEFTDALGMPEKGEIDTNKLVNQKMKVKVNGDQYQGEYRARVGRFAPIDASVGETTDEPEAEETTTGDEAEDYTTWELGDLVSAINDDEELAAKLPGLTLEGDDAATDEDKDYLVGFLEAADAETIDEYLAENPWEEGGGEEAEPVDYSTFSLDEVKEEIGRRGLAVPKGRSPKAKLIKILEDNDKEKDDVFAS
jgi:Protein of unknown function (DUF669)